MNALKKKKKNNKNFKKLLAVANNFWLCKMCIKNKIDIFKEN